MENVGPEKVIEILKAHNVNISLDQARLMLDFIVKFAHIAVTKIT